MARNTNRGTKIVAVILVAAMFLSFLSALVLILAGI